MRKKRSEFVKWMGPILDALRELKGSGKPREVVDLIAERKFLSDATLEETLKSGQSRFYNQVHWARQYLVWEGFLGSETRGVWTLTPLGSKTDIDEEEAHKIFLKWVKIHADARINSAPQSSDKVGLGIVDEQENENENLLIELLRRITPEGFEQVCALLLRKLGFEKVLVTGAPNDKGIDGFGILQVNPFVSFKVLFQCKRYKKVVARKEVAEFRNAMIGRADKGIIMTTGSFTTEARREAERDGAPPVELVDAERLVEMFEKAELGLTTRTVYDVDYSFFSPYMSVEVDKSIRNSVRTSRKSEK
jgi:restriction system protein